MAGKLKSAKGGAQNAKAPISSHPIFPVVVAIWFAALLGFGSLILPVVLFEKFFAVTGIGSLFPAAQAPLGMTARLLIACAAALTGAAAGVFVARKASASRAQPAQRRFRTDKAGDRAAKQPINAMEEFGAEGLDEPVDEKRVFKPQLAGKRRSLAVTDDSGPSDFLEFAPLPGGAAGLDPSSYVEQEPLYLDDFAQDDHREDEDTNEFDLARSLIREPGHEADNAPTQGSGTLIESSPEPAVAPLEFGRNGSGEPFKTVADQLTETTEIEADVAQEHAPMTDDTANHGLYNPLAERDPVNFEPAKPFGAPSMAAPQAAFAAPVPAAFAESPAPVAPHTPAEAEPSTAQAPALHELGIAELVERFASALQSRSANPAPQVAPTADQAAMPAAFAAPMANAEPQEASQAAEPVVAPAPVPASFPATPAAEPMVFRRAQASDNTLASPIAAVAPTIPHAMDAPVLAPASAPFSAPMPDALRPLAIDESYTDYEQDDDAGLTLSLDSAQIYQPSNADMPAQANPHFAQDSSHVDGDDEYNSGDDSYSSLLNMKSALGAQREFVRIEDEEPQGQAFEPVVVFPGQQDRQTQPAFDTNAREPAFPAPNGNDLGPRPFDSPVATPRTATKPAEAGETERALREALEKLQRMSGAA